MKEKRENKCVVSSIEVTASPNWRKSRECRRRIGNNRKEKSRQSQTSFSFSLLRQRKQSEKKQPSFRSEKAASGLAGMK